MGHLRQSAIREARDPAFAILLAAIGVSLVKATDQPGLSVGLAATSLRIVLSDVLLACLAVALALRIVRTRTYPRRAALLTITALAFAALILTTALANGSTAFVAGGKLVSLAALLVGCAVLIDSTDRLWIVILLILVVTAAAVAWGLVGFARHPGSRQASFLGEHDLAALSTACLIVFLAALHCRHRLSHLPVVAGVVGCVGILLGAALASLLSLYMAIVVLIVMAAFRRSLRLRSVAITMLIALVITGGTYSLRAGDLGFLQQWFAPVENPQPGQYAGSWSQRLIFVYIGGRIFVEHPALGTGWWGNLPPSEYARFLPDARRRFPDQPSRYFPPAGGSFIPQQTFDQVAYELGVVGIALFLTLLVAAGRDAVRSARGWRPGDTDELAAYLGAPWLASLIGAIAGSALFGGTPMAALFWLTFGLIAALSVLAAAGTRKAGTAG